MGHQVVPLPEPGQTLQCLKGGGNLGQQASPMMFALDPHDLSAGKSSNW